MTTLNSTDHRSRVAQERRERMRQRLIESAMLVFAEKGVDASVIDDVIAAANVSRGSFYNYFRTNTELLGAVGEQLGNEMMQIIEPLVGGIADPAARIATGLRLYLWLAQEYPLLGRFVSRAGLSALSPNSLVFEYLPPHLVAGVALGRFVDTGIEVALDLIAGTMLLALSRISRGEIVPDYDAQVVATVMMGLGVPVEEARRLARMSPPAVTIADGTLLARSVSLDAAT